VRERVTDLFDGWFGPEPKKAPTRVRTQRIERQPDADAAAASAASAASAPEAASGGIVEQWIPASEVAASAACDVGRRVASTGLAAAGSRQRGERGRRRAGCGIGRRAWAGAGACVAGERQQFAMSLRSAVAPGAMPGSVSPAIRSNRTFGFRAMLP
jgi:hypothetical protein